MRLPLLIILAFVAAPACAEDWFTIYGYPELPESDVIQISPVLSAWQQQVTLEVRATRKSVRTGYNGQAYRSYQGMAMVDCVGSKGWFLTLTFFSQANWTGDPAAVSSFQPEEAPMVFKDIPGSPAVKLIRAACAAAR